MVGGVGNGAAEEDLRWDLNPGVAAIPNRGSQGFGRVGSLWAAKPPIPNGNGGPCGFDKSQDHVALASFWDHAAWAEKNHGLLFLFLRYGAPDWAEGEGRTVRLF